MVGVVGGLGLEVQGDDAVGFEGIDEAAFEAGGVGVRGFEADVVGEDEVEFDPGGASGGAVAQVMPAGDVAGQLAIEYAAEGRVGFGIALIHDAFHREPQQPVPLEADVTRDGKADDDINEEPAGEVDDEEGSNDPGAGPHVGEGVPTVADGDHAVVLFPDRNDIAAQPEVDERRANQHDEPRAHVLNDDAGNQALDSIIYNSEGGGYDDGAFRADGKQFDAFVPVVMVVVGRFEAEVVAVHDEGDGENVDDGFEGVGKGGRRSGDDESPDFEREGDRGNSQAEQKRPLDRVSCGIIGLKHFRRRKTFENSGVCLQQGRHSWRELTVSRCVW